MGFFVAASDQQLLDAAKDSLLRILSADTEEWYEGGHRQRLLDIDRLQKTIDLYERRIGAASRRTFIPIRSISDG